MWKVKTNSNMLQEYIFLYSWNRFSIGTNFMLVGKYAQTIYRYSQSQNKHMRLSISNRAQGINSTVYTIY